jgi:hypothetical protein
MCMFIRLMLVVFNTPSDPRDQDDDRRNNDDEDDGALFI